MKPPISSEEAKIVKRLSSLLDKTKIEELAHSTGFICRERKLKGFVFMLLMNELSIKLESEGIFISKQGVDNRFNEPAVRFMKELTFDILSSKLDRGELLENALFFNRIIAKDSTVFQLPAGYSRKYKGSGGGASDAGIKIQYEYNLKANTGLGIELQSSSTPDIQSRFQHI